MASRSWNRVELIGNLTRDPEMRYTPSGTAVATFSIATNRSFVTDGERKEEVDFHRIVAWGKLAELCSQLIKKGNRVFVSGRLQNRTWEGQDGQQRNTTEIVIEDMILLTSRAGGAAEYDDSASSNEFKAASASASKESTPKDESEEPPVESAKEKPAKAPKEEKEDVDIDDLPF